MFLAQTNLDKPVAQWYGGVVLIMLIGILAITLLLLIFVTRRWARRQRNAIERDKAHRRQSREGERIDAWSAGADRYVDQDKLSDDMPYDSEPDADSSDESLEQEPDEDEMPRGWGQQPEEREAENPEDPFGLFNDKPYRDAGEDDEDDDDDEDEPFDPEDDEEEPRA